MASTPRRQLTARRMRQLQDRQKLTPWDELAILESTESPRVLAERYGVHYTTIYWIRYREQWREEMKQRYNASDD
jgi:hypothetical protein